MTEDQMEDVGWEISACRKEYVLLSAILLHLLNVLKEKLPVTWEPMMDAGWEITVYQKVSEYLLCKIRRRNH